MERVNLTENEKLSQTLLGLDSNAKTFNMNEKGVEETLNRESKFKLDAQTEKFNEILEENQEEFNKAVADTPFNTETAEIKPMFNRVLIKPFKVNPFQKTVQENGIITDIGGATPRYEINPKTGKYEEQKQFIVTGLVVEVGPEIKYLKEGDVIYYRVDTVVPVPFYRQGFVSLAESQIIAVVSNSLTERFNKVNTNA